MNPVLRKNVLLLLLCLLVTCADLVWQLPETDVFLTFRLPRVLAAVCAGICLSLCGLVLQSLFRNPLAGPFLIGITPGASFATGLLLLVFPHGLGGGLLQEIGLAGAGMTGGMLVLLLQLRLSRGMNGLFALLLTGVMLSYLLGAGVEIMETFAGAEQVRSFVMWGQGNFDRVQLQQLWIFGLFSAAGLVAVFMLRYQLDAWLPGEHYARNAGVNTGTLRITTIWLTGMLAGVTTALCGPVGFVGLVAPHLARLQTKSNRHGTLLFPVMLWGILLCALADLLAHHLFGKFTLNVNAVCAILGAPVVLWTLWKTRLSD